MTVALIAGSGRLPSLLAPWCEVVVGIRGETLEVEPEMELRLEKIGSVAKALARRVDGVCFAGGLSRPVFEPDKVDADTGRHLVRLTKAMSKGDDAALREVLAIFEDEGLRIVGADELRPDLLVGKKLWIGRPTERDLADAVRGNEILRCLSAADVGQSCVVAQGLCLAIEALPGTDHMLQVVADGLGGRRPNPSRGRGVLVKRSKAGQDLRVDRPAVGPDTVRAVAAAGLGGIAVGAEILLIGEDETAAAANAAGIAIWSLG